MAKIKILDVETMGTKTCAELRELCKKYKIEGMSKARKDDIIEALDQFFNDQEDSYEADKPKDENKYVKEIRNTNNESIPVINAHVHSINKGDNKFDTFVSVSCGASSSNYPVVGKTVGYVKAIYKEILNISEDSNGIVNGDDSSDSYVLRSGDILEFVRKAGSKG